MSEIKTEMSLFKVDKACDNAACGGRMIPTGRALLSKPTQYPHKCNKCGHEENYREQYPFMTYEEKK